MEYDLQRFKDAQRRDYERALSEIRSGRKRTHWMWYVFPQLRGLGHSETAYQYGISGLEEARAYLNDPALGARLKEISEALMQLEDKDASCIFGWPDDLKLRSCMTLFSLVSEPDSVFHRVLDAYFDGERDERTLMILKGTP